jgi:4-alpha-glucanotransferase
MLDENSKKGFPTLPGGRRAGLGMHFSSLPGQYGIGDISDDAFSFIDHLVEMGIGVWQFLPTGPTAYGDSPYQPLSAFAGNAMLIGPGSLRRQGLLTESEVAPLTELPQANVDYGSLIPHKSAILCKAASRFASGPGQKMSTAYEEFLHLNADNWLDDYVLFRFLKTLHRELSWPAWERPYIRRSPQALQTIKNNYREELEQIRVVQFLFQQQWQELQNYATKKGVCLFGDMPIYISLDSSDAWMHPELLRINRDGVPTHVAGVPPDYFSEDGQLWGNPLYDWNYHAETAYDWWINRVRYGIDRVDLLRIDHFRGFESFWSVPFGDETARGGQWEPGPADALFEALQQALGKLPIVAEDLGVITDEVDELRQRHNIPGMKVLQFEVGEADFDINDIEENCLCYTGTHDNDTAVGWFQGDDEGTRTRQEILQTRKSALEQTGGSPETIHLDLIRLAFSSRAAIAIAPMQDFLGLDSQARLNTPGTTLNNWRWRLQAGQLQTGFLDAVNELVNSASRARP